MHLLRILILLPLLCAPEILWSKDQPSPIERPNIVWIMVDDMSPHLSCYGETTIKTPHLDRLATEGARFTRAFVTGPICSISRSALMTGCYQTAIGCQNHRSSTPRWPIQLPSGMKPIPQLLREAGYHTSNLSFQDFMKSGGNVGVAKTDYNFIWDRAATYDLTHWTSRAPGKPFFVQVQLHGGKHRGQAPRSDWPTKVKTTLGSITRAEDVKLPPSLPDDPVIREDWAQYLDTVRYTDWEVGQIIDRLKQAGELDRTLILFWTDHGISHVRAKQFLYDAGLHVPLLVRGPGVPAGTVRNDLVEHIDIAAATLTFAKIPQPSSMQAKNPFSVERAEKPFVFAARDRADETVDRIRSVRSLRYKYIRNFYPSRPYLQPNRYKDEKAIVRTMRRLHTEKKLTSEQSLIMAETRPQEEFYDLNLDPHELRNLAEDPLHQQALEEHRRALDEWMIRTDDRGREAESEAVYLDAIYDQRPEGGRGQTNATFEHNVELMRRWSREKPMMTDLRSSTSKAWSFLTNETFIIGVDTSRGAGIGYFARRADGRNVLNHYDTGRFVQQSYYGDADGSMWANQPWRYNPVQGGGFRQEWPAETLALTRSKSELYARVRPRHWATGKELPEVLMEQWIRLETNVAHARFRMTYSGEDQLEARDQEMPAVFTDFTLNELVTYQGSKPWQQEPLSHLIVEATDPPRNAYVRRDEEWSAWVESGLKWGVGVYTPGASGITYYRYSGGQGDGPSGSRCSYFAPIRKFRLTKGLIVDYETLLTIGSVDEIRSAFTRHRSASVKTP
ncbi:MAG: sulfatase [Verrucomicrobia bacterium]|nr:sulfatase [Verrucomicrobiota bacterium]